MEEKQNLASEETQEMNPQTEASENQSEGVNEEVKKEPNQAEAQLQEMQEKYLRLMAEFENYKRRTAKEKQEIILTGGKDVMLPLLEVIDDVERAEASKAQVADHQKQVEGFELIFTKLKNILQQRGLKPMQTIGTYFNADEQEAITEIEAGEEMKGKVVDEVVKGYMLNDKIIRFAKVIVGK